MTDAAGGPRRRLLLPQEIWGRRMMARLVARRGGPSRQREEFERYFGPDGIVCFEAVLGNVIGAALGIFGGATLAAVTGRGAPQTAGLWMMFAGVIFAVLIVGRALQAMRAGRAFRRRRRS